MAAVVIHGQVVADTAAEWYGQIIFQYHQVVHIAFKLDAVAVGVVQQADVHVGLE